MLSVKSCCWRLMQQGERPASAACRGSHAAPAFGAPDAAARCAAVGRRGPQARLASRSTARAPTPWAPRSRWPWTTPSGTRPFTGTRCARAHVRLGAPYRAHKRLHFRLALKVKRSEVLGLLCLLLRAAQVHPSESRLMAGAKASPPGSKRGVPCAAYPHDNVRARCTAHVCARRRRDGPPRDGGPGGAPAAARRPGETLAPRTPQRSKARRVGPSSQAPALRPARHEAALWCNSWWRALQSLARRRWSEAEAAKVAARSVLPEPMVRGNWESSADRCFVGERRFVTHPGMLFRTSNGQALRVDLTFWACVGSVPCVSQATA